VRVCLANETHARCTPLHSVIYVSLDRLLRWGRMEDSLCPPDSRHGWVPCIMVVAGLKLNFENQTTKVVDMLTDDGAFSLVPEGANADGYFVTRNDKIGHKWIV